MLCSLKLIMLTVIFFSEILNSRGNQFTNEPHREKTGLLPMRKQRRRSASQ